MRTVCGPLSCEDGHSARCAVRLAEAVAKEPDELAMNFQHVFTRDGNAALSDDCFGVKYEKSTNAMESYHRKLPQPVGKNCGVV